MKNTRGTGLASVRPYRISRISLAPTTRAVHVRLVGLGLGELVDLLLAAVELEAQRQAEVIEQERRQDALDVLHQREVADAVLDVGLGLAR